MFYFFQRGAEYIRCEINESDGGFVIIITDPKGTTRTERLETSNDVQVRFEEIQADFRSDGWWGPHGRE